MAFPTVGSFDYSDPSVIVVKVTPDGGSETVMAQIQRFTGQSRADRTKKTFRAIGQGSATTAYGTAEYTHTITLGFTVEPGAAEEHTILGYTAAGAAIQLDVESISDMAIEVYDNREATAAVQHTYNVTDFAPEDWSVEIDADADAEVATITGTATLFALDNS